MSLRRIKNNDYEIGRLCTVKGTMVVGGSEKLFKKLKESVTWDSIISYNDLDKFSGVVYERLGMFFIKYTISYFYTNGRIRESRQKYQKSKLIKMGKDPLKTELQITNSMGLKQVYTCGNSKWIIINKAT